MSSQTFKIHVVKDNIVFCSGHFITYEGQCEPLHGHNYRASVTLEGAPDENQYVFNFVTLKRLMKGLCDRLDHRMLLPANNPLLKIDSGPDGFTVRYGNKKYMFPGEDVVQLPVSNTTAERLAEWLCGELETALRAAGAAQLTAIEVEVEETFGQSAVYRKELSVRPAGS
jgi:6-pyruvoyltetrahydropterin/6-carboxytetrahydropterin synthase